MLGNGANFCSAVTIRCSDASTFEARARVFLSDACSYFIIADDKFDIHYVDEGSNEIPPDQALAKAGHAKKPKTMLKAAPTPKS